MKQVLISIIALLFTLFSYGQGKVKSFNNCDTDDDVSKVYQGDTVIIECNVAYILNNNVLNNYYKALQNNRGCTEIVKTYAALSNTQDSVIDQQNKRFNELRAKFDSLGNNTGQFLTITQGSLSQIGDTLSNVSRTIVQTQNLLSQTKLLLEQEQKNKWKDRLKWGIGGVGVGLVASTLVFIAVR
jgi:uncharacterized protein YpbB